MAGLSWKFKLLSQANPCSAEPLALLEGDVVIEITFGGAAVRQHGEFVLAHVGVVGGKQDTQIGGHSCEHEVFYFQVFQQRDEGCRVERRVPGLKDEIICG